MIVYDHLNRSQKFLTWLDGPNRYHGWARLSYFEPQIFIEHLKLAYAYFRLLRCEFAHTKLRIQAGYLRDESVPLGEVVGDLDGFDPLRGHELVPPGGDASSETPNVRGVAPAAHRSTD